MKKQKNLMERWGKNNVTDDKRTFDRSGFPVYNVEIVEEEVTDKEGTTDATQDKSDVW